MNYYCIRFRNGRIVWLPRLLRVIKSARTGQIIQLAQNEGGGKLYPKRNLPEVGLSLLTLGAAMTKSSCTIAFGIKEVVYMCKILLSMDANRFLSTCETSAKWFHDVIANVQYSISMATVFKFAKYRQQITFGNDKEHF